MGARSSRFFLSLTLLSIIPGLSGRASAAPKQEGEEEKARNDACASAGERGQRERNARKLLEAREDFRACRVASCPVQVRADCEKWFGELEEEIPSIVLRARDSRDHDVIAVRVYANDRLITDHLDGGAIDMDPGPYELRCETASGAVAREKILPSLTEQNREILVRFDVPLDADGNTVPIPPTVVQPPIGPISAPWPPPPVAEAHDRTLGYVFASIGVAALGAFGYFEYQGQTGYSDLEKGCGRFQTCKPSDVDPVRTDFILAGSFLAVSVVSAGLATWQFLLPGRPAAAAQLRAGIVPGLAFTAFKFHF
jgi:hypothetical protein